MDDTFSSLIAKYTDRKSWDELRKDTTVRLKNDFCLIMQRIGIIELCEREMAKFPEVVKESAEAGEAIKEIEDLTKDG